MNKAPDNGLDGPAFALHARRTRAAKTGILE